MASRNPYVKFWYVRSHSDPNKQYKVSQRKDGSFACSCPHWIYRRATCKHILGVINNGMQAIRVENPIIVGYLKTFGEWCEQIDNKRAKLTDEIFDRTWQQILDLQGQISNGEWKRLENEFTLTEDFWRRRA